MRSFIAGVLAWATLYPATVLAQSKGPPIKINQMRVGFRSYVADEAPGRFKVGMWAPVYIHVQAGPLGLPKADLLLETADSESVATVYAVPIGSLGKDELRTILTYTKPGNSEGRFTVSVRAADRNVVPPVSNSLAPMRLPERLYLTLGARVAALQDALIELRMQRADAGQNPDQRDSFPRYAAFESDPKLLPTLALGYDAVDLMFLTTGRKEMLDHLLHDMPRLKAIGEWVRQGGRLVISCNATNQQLVSRLMESPAWQPPLPVMPPADAKGEPLKRLQSVETWAHLTDKPFPALGQKPVPIALLQRSEAQRPLWEVEAETPDGRPLIGTMPYGRGNITLLAFDLDKGPFPTWNGRAQFLKTLVSRLEPRIPQNLAAAEQNMFEPNLGGQDLSSQLQIKLDEFDVPIIPFGWVALFIVIYILIVGPLDYIILKKVFKRLEGTWITFPAVVLAVSVIAYFTAYAVKGRDLKINKIDLVDIDLRTDLDKQDRPRKAFAYGNTWFTIMSPRIQSYTIGIEPTVAGWWGAGNEAPASADVVSWLGRPETDGPGAMGRPRAQGWSHRSYAYMPEAAGLSGVPIPVWTTKSFTAAWEASLPRLPIEADLMYHFNPKHDIKLTGTIKSFLPADLEDVWIFYRDKVYKLGTPLRGGKAGGETRKIALAPVAQIGEDKVQTIDGQDIARWHHVADAVKDRPVTQKGMYNPTSLMKEILFQVQVDSGGSRRNQALHRLDLSWRLQKEPTTAKSNIRDVIIYGRLAPAVGDAEEITRNQVLPTALWLGEVPGPNRTRPTLVGNMTQDTYVRIIMAAKPAQ